jgi:hypothetical protein
MVAVLAGYFRLSVTPKLQQRLCVAQFVRSQLKHRLRTRLVPKLLAPLHPEALHDASGDQICRGASRVVRGGNDWSWPGGEGVLHGVFAREFFVESKGLERFEDGGGGVRTGSGREAHERNAVLYRQPQVPSEVVRGDDPEALVHRKPVALVAGCSEG